MIFISFVLFLIYSCNATKQIPEGQAILRENKVNVVKEDNNIINDFFYKDILYDIPKQKPNKKFLGIPLSESIWAFYNSKKVTKFSQYMKTKIGSAPVIFDSTKLPMSNTAFYNYYFNSGYFDNQPTSSYKIKNKIAKVTYTIQPNNPYIIKKVIRDTSTDIEKLVYYSPDKSTLEAGSYFTIDSLQNEIIRITNIANNNGYFNFSKEFVRYKLDTFKKDKSVEVYVIINKQSDSTDFKVYQLDSIHIQINKEDASNDTAKLNITTIDNKIFYQTSPRQYREDFINRFIFQNPDGIYSKKLVSRSIQKLSELNNFKLINSIVNIKDTVNRKIDLYYALTPYKKYNFSVGPSVYNSTLGLIGTSLSLTYKDRNLTKRADRLDISMAGSVEFNAYLNNQRNYSGLISRTDISFIGDYKLDKFVLPLLFSKKRYYLYNISEIYAHYTYSKRLGYYDIHNVGVNMGYKWSSKTSNAFTYHPIMFNFVYIPEGSISSQFQDRLNQNPFLKSSFSSAFILGSDFSFSHFNNFGKKKNTFKLRLDLETAGNTAYIANQIFRFDTGVMNINGINVSQYLKLQGEIGFANVINPKSSINSRLKSGIVIPYLNSKEVPYIKQFYIGGQYSIRAFQARTIGPGSFDPNSNNNDSTTNPKDQLGNLNIEANIEYRFNIVSFLNGALFCDMGNLWYTRKSFFQSEDGIFKFKNFLNQFYIGTGAGVRLDFSYFVLRLDLGVPVRVPYGDQESQWVILDAKPFNGSWISNNVVFNFAVGYPF